MLLFGKLKDVVKLCAQRDDHVRAQYYRNIFKKSLRNGRNYGEVRQPVLRQEASPCRRHSLGSKEIDDAFGVRALTSSPLPINVISCTLFFVKRCFVSVHNPVTHHVHEHILVRKERSISIRTSLVRITSSSSRPQLKKEHPHPNKPLFSAGCGVWRRLKIVR